MSRLAQVLAVILVLLAVLLGVFAFNLARQPAQQTEPVQRLAPAPQAVAAVKVAVAARAAGAGEVLTAEDIRLADWPTAPEEGFSTVEPLLGRILRFDVNAGAALTESQLASGLAVHLQDGERAVAVAVDEVLGIGNRVQPGDWVDVFFTLPRVGEDAQRNQARLLLSRIRVLAYGRASVDGPPPHEEGERDDRNTRRGAQPATAVLAVPVAWVNDLLLARTNGKLQLALRSPLDLAGPDVGLFPEPGTVLAGRRGLTAEEQAVLKSADNRAYAGADLMGLAGPLPGNPPRRAPSTGAARPGLEVVRGTQSRQEVY